MSNSLYLIAHKVRGEPAFDIAQRMCEGDEMCQGDCGLYPDCKTEPIWIIPTSGHRAFPLMNWPLNALCHNTGTDYDWGPDVTTECGPIEHHNEWSSLRDHYLTEAVAAKSLVDILGLIHAPLTRQPPIKRRF